MARMIRALKDSSVSGAMTLSRVASYKIEGPTSADKGASSTSCAAIDKATVGTAPHSRMMLSSQSGSFS
jgi:hypothetical protein